MLSNYELKANAREQLGGGIFAGTWLTVLLAYVILSLITGALSFTFIGMLLVTGPLTYGFSRLCYKVARGSREVDLLDLFKGFTESFSQSLILWLVQGVYTLLWSLLFVIPGIVKSYSYSMAFFIQQKTGEEWRSCLEQSVSYTNGYKWQLFCLDLSFIGWYILGALAFGVGVFFVKPYHELARTNFFMALYGEEAPAAPHKEYDETEVEEIFDNAEDKSNKF